MVGHRRPDPRLQVSPQPFQVTLPDALVQRARIKQVICVIGLRYVLRHLYDLLQRPLVASYVPLCF
jgi:hypothetical protein